jgi:hypothetical protein
MKSATTTDETNITAGTFADVTDRLVCGRICHDRSQLAFTGSHNKHCFTIASLGISGSEEFLVRKFYGFLLHSSQLCGNGTDNPAFAHGSPTMNSKTMANKIFLWQGTRILGKRTGFEVSFPVIGGVVDVAFAINKISDIMMCTHACCIITHEASYFTNQPEKSAHEALPLLGD